MKQPYKCDNKLKIYRPVLSPGSNKKRPKASSPFKRGKTPKRKPLVVAGSQKCNLNSLMKKYISECEKIRNFQINTGLIKMINVDSTDYDIIKSQLINNQDRYAKELDFASPGQLIDLLKTSGHVSNSIRSNKIEFDYDIRLDDKDKKDQKDKKDKSKPEKKTKELNQVNDQNEPPKLEEEKNHSAFFDNKSQVFKRDDSIKFSLSNKSKDDQLKEKEKVSHSTINKSKDSHIKEKDKSLYNNSHSLIDNFQKSISDDNEIDNNIWNKKLQNDSKLKEEEKSIANKKQYQIDEVDEYDTKDIMEKEKKKKDKKEKKRNNHKPREQRKFSYTSSSSPSSPSSPSYSSSSYSSSKEKKDRLNRNNNKNELPTFNSKFKNNTNLEEPRELFISHNDKLAYDQIEKSVLNSTKFRKLDYEINTPEYIDTIIQKENEIKIIQSYYRKYKTKKQKRFQERVYCGWDKTKRNIIKIYFDKTVNTAKYNNLVLSLYVQIYSIEKMAMYNELISVSDLYDLNIVSNVNVDKNLILNQKEYIAERIFLQYEKKNQKDLQATVKQFSIRSHEKEVSKKKSLQDNSSTSKIHQIPLKKSKKENKSEGSIDKFNFDKPFDQQSQSLEDSFSI